MLLWCTSLRSHWCSWIPRAADYPPFLFRVFACSSSSSLHLHCFSWVVSTSSRCDSYSSRLAFLQWTVPQLSFLLYLLLFCPKSSVLSFYSWSQVQVPQDGIQHLLGPGPSLVLLSPNSLSSRNNRPMNQRRGVEVRITTLFRKPADHLLWVWMPYSFTDQRLWRWGNKEKKVINLANIS